MRRLIVIFPLVLFVALGLFLWNGIGKNTESIPSPLIGKAVPEFSLSDLLDEQQIITAADLKGRPALLNVWATWCPTCKAEHAQLNRMVQNEGVTIYGVNYKDDREKAKIWLDNYRNPYAVNIYDPEGKLGLNLGVYGAPETFLLDAQGVIRYKHIGAIDERVWNDLRERMKLLEVN
ncbi:DsbE family thiol:disulfide interchange protein [Amphritea sp. 2_MG-2023]|jgi:cytochrome c biogenesis protein CcmG/thiol:disulfide interchange protein DsbE|uniref:DsbE family thiol:disulfide interchange protein n=1 Tax=Amphritea TaxID=515417 RepID=UPI001C06A4A1|nr:MULTISPECIES: DsbE family thiol:disulfide interchange protein [Amphritea]MBU2964786.1 DsbE family thiol:disulfide interchange protein [Amphritea atlantica]MDO6419638.1 DsbE family thiol:disulfide interchange protein [Amphritea sp. 2_MG-2023]MDX2422836.1 DsbE family thiol:disulfide interchange protein [Amphritea sp.]